MQQTNRTSASCSNLGSLCKDYSCTLCQKGKAAFPHMQQVAGSAGSCLLCWPQHRNTFFECSARLPTEPEDPQEVEPQAYLPRCLVCRMSSRGARISLAYTYSSSSSMVCSARMAPMTARQCLTASTTFPVPASPCTYGQLQLKQESTRNPDGFG